MHIFDYSFLKGDLLPAQLVAAGELIRRLGGGRGTKYIKA